MKKLLLFPCVGFQQTTPGLVHGMKAWNRLYLPIPGRHHWEFNDWVFPVLDYAVGSESITGPKNAVIGRNYSICPFVKYLCRILAIDDEYFVLGAQGLGSWFPLFSPYYGMGVDTLSRNIKYRNRFEFRYHVPNIVENKVLWSVWDVEDVIKAETLWYRIFKSINNVLWNIEQLCIRSYIWNSIISC